MRLIQLLVVAFAAAGEQAVLDSRTDIVKKHSAHDNHIHEVLFVVKNKEGNELENMFYEVADPSSPRFRQFLNREDAGRLVENEESTNAVLNFLRSQNFQVSEVSHFGQFVTARAPVHVLSSLFNAQFHHYDYITEVPEGIRRGKTTTPTTSTTTTTTSSSSSTATSRVRVQDIVRAREYSLPSSLTDHVDAVLNIADFPYPNSIHSHFEFIDETGSEETSISETDTNTNNDTYNENVNHSTIRSFASSPSTPSAVTPTLLRQTYSIPPSSTSPSPSASPSKTSQCVFATNGQHYSPQDLSAFRAAFFLPASTAVTARGPAHNSSSRCISSPASCTEGNLDVQYMLGVSPDVPLTYWYDNSTNYFLLDWIKAVSASSSPPHVLSISYAVPEMYLSKGYVRAFDKVVMSLGLRGVTVVAASGDYGVSGSAALGCAYYPLWPASSPYVTSVGATQGPESGRRESVCMANKGGHITSGGGFSGLYQQPAWQKAAVDAYFSDMPMDKVPLQGSDFPLAYYRNGRAYPDVSVLGFNYQVMIGGKWVLISGTSAAAPVFGGMISLINSARMEAGLSPVGWINREIYSNHTQFVRDVVSGNNKCKADSSACCPQGFHSRKGWDPASGWGSVHFPALFDSLVYNNDSGYRFNAASHTACTIGRLELVTALVASTAFLLMYS